MSLLVTTESFSWQGIDY